MTVLDEPGIDPGLPLWCGWIRLADKKPWHPAVQSRNLAALRLFMEAVFLTTDYLILADAQDPNHGAVRLQTLLAGEALAAHRQASAALDQALAQQDREAAAHAALALADSQRLLTILGLT